jgi:hypothetical protein
VLPARTSGPLDIAVAYRDSTSMQRLWVTVRRNESSKNFVALREWVRKSGSGGFGRRLGLITERFPSCGEGRRPPLPVHQVGKASKGDNARGRHSMDERGYRQQSWHRHRPTLSCRSTQDCPRSEETERDQTSCSAAQLVSLTAPFSAKAWRPLVRGPSSGWRQSTTSYRISREHMRGDPFGCRRRCWRSRTRCRPWRQSG